MGEMYSWHPRHGWLAFERLDANEGLKTVFTIGFRIKFDAKDDWTGRFNRFKQRKPAALRGGVKLMRNSVSCLFKELGFDASRTVFIPALSSSETVACERGPLSLLARNCAETVNAEFDAKAISKDKHPSLHESGGAEERLRIVGEAKYNCCPIEADNVVIFDDIVTMGATMSQIAQAIHHANSKAIDVYGIALGKAVEREYHERHFGQAPNNDHVSDTWKNLWDEGESEYRQEQGEK